MNAAAGEDKGEQMESGKKKQLVKMFRRKSLGFQRGNPYLNELGRYVQSEWTPDATVDDLLERFDLDMSMDVADKVEVPKFIAQYHDAMEARFDAEHAKKLDKKNRKVLERCAKKAKKDQYGVEHFAEMEENRRRHKQKWDFDADGSNLFYGLMDHVLDRLEGEQRSFFVSSLMEYGLHRPAVFERYWENPELREPFARAYARNVEKYLVAQPLEFARFDFLWEAQAEAMKEELAGKAWLSDALRVAFEKYAMFFDGDHGDPSGFDFGLMRQNVNRMAQMGLREGFLGDKDLSLSVDRLSSMPKARIGGDEISLIENLVFEMLLQASRESPEAKRSSGLRI